MNVTVFGFGRRLGHGFMALFCAGLVLFPLIIADRLSSPDPSATGGGSVSRGSFVLVLRLLSPFWAAYIWGAIRRGVLWPGTGSNPSAEWYSVRSVFRFDKVEEGKPLTMFEERVVILRALSYEEALKKGRDEAHRYAASDPNPKMLDHVVAFALWEEALKEGEEVWCCLRESKMSDAEFLSHVYAGERLGRRHID